MSRNAPSLFCVAGTIAALFTLGCSDASRSVAPSDRPIRSSAAAGGTIKDHYELTGSIDQDLVFECLDEPIRFVVSYTWTFDLTNTPSGISSVKSAFIVDRSKSFTVYKGVTYYVAQGRPGHDDIIHYVYGPDGLYIEAGVEPDFERADTGERLNLQFTWHIVVGPDGTTRVAKFTGSCPPAI